MTTIVRPQVSCAPRIRFVDDGALQAFSDGAAAFAGGRIAGVRNWSDRPRGPISCSDELLPASGEPMRKASGMLLAADMNRTRAEIGSVV